MTIKIVLSTITLLCASCAAPQPSSGHASTETPTSAPSNTSGKKPDMKALFGPDYQKGDIGHSKGTVTAIDPSGAVTISHSVIHGTAIESATSRFEPLPSAKDAVLASNDQVEFLIKKGEGNTYRLLKICTIAPSETGCL